MRDFGFSLLESVQTHLLGQQVLHRNVNFFVLGVAGQIDGFHTIKQRRINGIAVACGHKHHVGQIKADINVVILELAILFRIEHFEKRRGRISSHSGTQFVDFVQKKQRILHSHLSHGLDDLAGHRTDIGTAMTANVA